MSDFGRKRCVNDYRREELNIVFYLDSDYEEIQIGETRFGQAVQIRGIDDGQALRLIVDIIRQFGMEMVFTRYLPKPQQIPVDKYLKQVEKKGKYFLPVEVGGLKFSFGRIPAFNQAFLSIEEVIAGSAVSWDNWLNPFLEVSGFAQAWVTDAEYDYWQNAKSLLLYETEGRSYKHLPTKSNGLPPPLDGLEIDTSDNPGRWVLKSGYREAVGSRMWLSSLFWQLAGTDIKDVELSANGFDVQYLSNGITKIIAAENCFCDGTTEEAQRKLRSILYDKKP